MTTPGRFPPLVEPGPPLDRDQLARGARHLMLPQIGEPGQRRLRAARVLVVGAGGLGSPVLLYLAAAGVGTIGIVDDDRVDVSNLQRQVVHRTAAVGEAKVASAARAVHELDPSITVHEHRERLTAASAADLVRRYDVVLDGSDNFATRYLVDEACAAAGVPDVWGSVLGTEGMVSVFWAGRGPRYTDLHAEAPPDGAVPSCAEGGVLGALCGTIGTIMAAQAVLLLCGTGDPLVGRVLVHDVLDAGFRTVPLLPRRRPATARAEVPPAARGGAGGAGAEDAGNVVPTVSPAELRGLLREPDAVLLVDVRSGAERTIAAIDGSVPLSTPELTTAAADGTLPRDRKIVVMCRSGVRSAAAVAAVHRAGRPDVVSLDGGLLRWIDEVDPTLVRY